MLCGFTSGQIQLPSGVTLAPLTQSLVNQDKPQLKKFNVTGSPVNVDASNALSLTTSDIALISCDSSAYHGELDASATVANVLTSQQKASAVLLYSSTATHCNFTANDDNVRQYNNVFTLVSPQTADTLKDQLNSEDHDRSASIVAEMYSPTPAQGGSGGGTDSGSDSPNTGIITALFLGIIITGALRAHRHPERYGPRYTTGRPRQSRAKGIARAMLETIPIVKFGDDHNPKEAAMKGDVEMSMSSREQVAEHSPEQREAAAADETTAPPSQQNEGHISSEPNQNQQNKSSSGTTTPAAGPPQETINFSCPICTDDFIKGQDLRVLPCNHKFHPECVDPWLVNVSGTCPLCRIDLNPSQPEGENETGEAEDNTETTQDNNPAGAAEQQSEAVQGRQHHRLTNYLHGTLNARRMRDASVEERLAALRVVRAEANREDAAEDAEEGQNRRSRLTTRLRDRFRIRTRPHENEGEATQS
ncbi:hypothetical protein MW887_006359 [Aspergillus wentii]|nr:hypothetical protein MW887_006359 [Aspergillus wentii]